MPAVSAQFRQLDSGQRTRADSGASFTPVIHKSPATASGPSYFFRLAGFGPLSGRIVLATWASSKLQIDFEHIQNEMYNIISYIIEMYNIISYNIETHTSQHHGSYEKGLTNNCNGNCSTVF